MFSMDNSKEQQIKQRILSSTKFTEKWMNGEEVLNFEEFSTLMGENFRMIMVNGQMLDKKAIESLMKHMFGQWNVSIDIEEIKIREMEGLVIATYCELHKSDMVETRTRATSIFRSDNLKWVHFHVTTIK